jgi:hypothetical protein
MFSFFSHDRAHITKIFRELHSTRKLYCGKTVQTLCAFLQVFAEPAFRAARFLLPYSNRLATIHLHWAALVGKDLKLKANWNFSRLSFRAFRGESPDGKLR